MSVIDKLMESAKADIGVLTALDSQGDDFNLHRNVDFLINTPGEDQASHICGFINDYNFGSAKIQVSEGGEFSVLVQVNMPVNQHVITSVSGLMVCVAALFGGEFDGWGCSAQVQ